MRLIGLNGFKESGKDTTFELMRELESRLQLGHVTRAGFADKLKLMAAKALGFTTASDDECIALMNDFKEDGWIRVHLSNGNTTSLTGREYLQWFGGEARGVFGETFWIDQVLPTPTYLDYGQALEGKYPRTDILVITDVRYHNEAERVKQLGGEIWEIVKPDLQSDGHASEQPLPRELIDVMLLNDGTIDDLRQTVASAL